MKKQLMLVIFVLSLGLSLESCRSGHIDLGADDQEIIMTGAGGNVEPERFIDIKTKEARGYAMQTLYSEISNSITDGDYAKADSLQNLLDRMLYSTGVMYGNSFASYGKPAAPPIQVKLVNNSSDRHITVTSPPFTGVELKPGDKSDRSFMVPKGTIEISYTTTKDGRQSKKRYHYTTEETIYLFK